MARNWSNLAIAGGNGGGVGRWSPTGTNPCGPATYFTLIGVPSGAVYE